MSQKLMDVLSLGRCSHEFSWPRRAQDGDYYQVCLVCAAQYTYDWKTMRRTERVEVVAESRSLQHSRTHKEKRPTWVPRARRLKVDLAVRYRAKSTHTWFTGIIENISQSGVLFNGEHVFPANTLLEMIFEMPEEISGQKDANILCQGRIIRGKDARTKAGAPAQAASIIDYKFLHNN
jgi:PilZ domain